MADLSNEIERYHAGEMNPAELEAFERAIFNDPALKAEVENDAILRNLADLQVESETYSSVKASISRIKKRKHRTKITLLSGIAASIILMVVLSWNLFNQHARSYPELAVEYSSVWNLAYNPLMGTSQKTLTAITTAYQKNQYTQVIELSEKAIFPTIEDSIAASMYHGFALLQLAEYQKAEKQFKFALQHSSGWDDDAHFGLSIVEISKGDVKKAILHLDWLIQDPNDTSPEEKTLAEKMKKDILALSR